MKTIRIAAVAAAMAASLVAAAPAAMANSFDDYVGGGGRVWYNDGTDTICASLSGSSGYDVMNVSVYPKTAGRGPDYTFNVYPGDTKCRSLATAYEDSAYWYTGILGYDPPCRCGSRFGDDFFS